jgi:hypothetical protein
MTLIKKFQYYVISKEREHIRRCVCVLLVDTKNTIIDITILTMIVGGAGDATARHCNLDIRI